VERFDLDKKKTRVIHHGIDLEKWEEEGRESQERTKKAFALPSEFLLFVGAQEPRKNLPRLLQALPIIHERYGKIPLVLVGRRGLDTDNLDKIIREMGLDPWVKRVGYVNEVELKDFYRLASVFVFPSSREGFGLPLLEAMACGLPVVASSTSAMPEVAQDAAMYIDPNNPEDLATKIIHVLENPGVKEKLVLAGKNRVRSFSWERAARETVSFYEDVVRRS
jgi:glycosyltransferase involved in cell wall biosynthesis